MLDKKDKVIERKSGIGFTGLLTLIFITLKLTGYITWSWLWILSPIWITFLILFLLYILIVLLGTKINKY